MGRRVEYTARHVNTLASMVSRNLNMPHEIVCVTDDPAGIDGSVRIVPLWDDLKNHGRCFLRLKAFSPDMRDVLGERFVSFDLDTVIVSQIDSLLDRPEPFVVWSDPSRITPYCGSQWMLTSGYRPDVFNDFDPTEHASLKQRFGYFGSDQAWMAHKIPGAATWTKADGVYSFRMHILKTTGGDLTGMRFKRRVRGVHGARLPSNAKVVHFHGIYDPSMAHIQQQLPWVAEHWR